jgi:hypothetical protein
MLAGLFVAISAYGGGWLFSVAPAVMAVASVAARTIVHRTAARGTRPFSRNLAEILLHQRAESKRNDHV